jgi:hypothetical protein
VHIDAAALDDRAVATGTRTERGGSRRVGRVGSRPSGDFQPVSGRPLAFPIPRHNIELWGGAVNLKAAPPEVNLKSSDD